MRRYVLGDGQSENMFINGIMVIRNINKSKAILICHVLYNRI